MEQIEMAVFLLGFFAVMTLYFGIRTKALHDERERPFFPPMDYGAGNPWVLHFTWRPIWIGGSIIPFHWMMYVWRRKEFIDGAWRYNYQPTRNRPLTHEEILDAADTYP